MRAARWQEPATVGLVALAFALVALAPLAVLAAGALSAADLGPLGSPALWRLFARTAATAGAVTLAATLVGVPLGLVLSRSDIPGRRIALVLHASPLFLPPLIQALGWFHVLGRGGIAGSAMTSQLLFSTAGQIAVTTVALTPVVTLMTVLGLDGIDPSLEEAARIAAPPRRVSTRILLPLAWPSAALGALVAFALAIGELGVPVFLGVPAYPAAVFARLGGLDYAPGEAFALTAPLLAVGLLVLFAERALRRGRAYHSLGLRSDRPALELGDWRWPATALVWTVGLLGLIPIAALAARADLAAAWPWIGEAARSSLAVAVASATTVTAFGLVLGHQRARARRTGRALDAIALLLLVTPAAVLGAGLIALWNQSGLLPVYGTSAMIVLALAARYAVLGIRPLGVALARSSPALEDAARVAGAGYLRRLARIVGPLHVRALAATWLLVLVFCLRDVEAAALVYPPGGDTLTVRILTLEANGPPAVVAGLATALVALTALPVAVGLWLLRRSKR